MTTMVCFRGGDACEYAVPVEAVHEVRRCEAVLPLPAPRPGVAGLLRHDGGTIPVLTTFGQTGAHVMLLDHSGELFGIVVEQVTRVVNVEGSVQRAPRGQARECISGTLSTEDGLVLVLDVALLDEALQS